VCGYSHPSPCDSCTVTVRRIFTWRNVHIQVNTLATSELRAVKEEGHTFRTFYWLDVFCQVHLSRLPPYRYIHLQIVTTPS
jgi:hypothetical protein